MRKAFNYKRLALLSVPLALALIRVVYATAGEVDPSSMVAIVTPKNWTTY
jgi:hypothetical protein